MTRGLGVEQVIAEFEACCAGELDAVVGNTPVPGGAAVFCGSLTDSQCWNLTYVRDNQAVVPLAVGGREQVLRTFARLDKAEVPIWDTAKFPVPTVVVGGTAYHFAPVRGRVLLGLVKLARRAVLLAAVGTEIAVLHVAGRTKSVLHVGPPLSFRELDVDRMLALQGQDPTATRSDPLDPIRPSRRILAEHRRIVHGIVVDVGPGPTVEQVLAAAFEDIADRADAVRAAEKCRARGKTWVRYVLRRLVRLAQIGIGDLVGRVGLIIARIQQYCPDFTITSEAMSDVLGLLVATGTCIMAPHADDERVWRINLSGLDHPRSPLHRRLCRETRGRHPEVATGAAEAVIVNPKIRSAEPRVAAAADRPLDGAAAPVHAGSEAQGAGVNPQEAAPAYAQAAARGRDVDRPVDVAPVVAPQISDGIDAALAALSELPSEAAEMLRFAVRLSLGRRQRPRPTVEPSSPELDLEALSDRKPDPGPAGDEPAQPRQPQAPQSAAAPRSEPQEAGDPGGRPQPTPLTPRIMPASAWRRRLLHLSPDHTLVLPRIAIVAAASAEVGGPSHVQQPRRRGVADDAPWRAITPGTLGPRGPPAPEPERAQPIDV